MPLLNGLRTTGPTGFGGVQPTSFGRTTEVGAYTLPRPSPRTYDPETGDIGHGTWPGTGDKRDFVLRFYVKWFPED